MKINSQVQVRLDLVRDRISPDLFKLLSLNSFGKVVDYKMTDGLGIGVVLELFDGRKSWFFENEVESVLEDSLEILPVSFNGLPARKRKVNLIDFNSSKSDNKFKVNLSKVQDRISSDLKDILREDPNGYPVSYKVTDGIGVGIVLKLSDGTNHWFFEDELEMIDNPKYSFYPIEMEQGSSPLFLEIKTPERNISILSAISPFKFVNWLIYSLADVF